MKNEPSENEIEFELTLLKPIAKFETDGAEGNEEGEATDGAEGDEEGEATDGAEGDEEGDATDGAEGDKERDEEGDEKDKKKPKPSTAEQAIKELKEKGIYSEVFGIARKQANIAFIKQFNKYGIKNIDQLKAAVESAAGKPQKKEGDKDKKEEPNAEIEQLKARLAAAESEKANTLMSAEVRDIFIQAGGNPDKTASSEAVALIMKKGFIEEDGQLFTEDGLDAETHIREWIAKRPHFKKAGKRPANPKVGSGKGKGKTYNKLRGNPFKKN